MNVVNHTPDKRSVQKASLHRKFMVESGIVTGFIVVAAWLLDDELVGVIIIIYSLPNVRCAAFP